MVEILLTLNRIEKEVLIEGLELGYDRMICDDEKCKIIEDLLKQVRENNMPRNNFIAVIEEGDNFVGYNCCASASYKKISDYRRKGYEIFRESTMEEAVQGAKKAQEMWSSGYDYILVILGRSKK